MLNNQLKVEEQRQALKALRFEQIEMAKRIHLERTMQDDVLYKKQSESNPLTNHNLRLYQAQNEEQLREDSNKNFRIQNVQNYKPLFVKQRSVLEEQASIVDDLWAELDKANQKAGKYERHHEELPQVKFQTSYVAPQYAGK